jgi:hypothetical protein
MKTLILILTISFIATTDIVAQINPLGIYVDIDGKVKFWRSEANFNGNLDDTVYLTLDGETQLYDLRNLKFNYLTILQAPRSNWTAPSNLDPSRITNTSDNSIPQNTTNLYFSNPLISFDSISLNTNIIEETIPSIQTQEFFSDDIRGVGLNDSILHLVNDKLNNLIDRFYGKLLPYEQINQLRNEISYHDTVIEKNAIYDYLVDMIVTYEYDGIGRLRKVLGYHWNLGIEVDSLKYDKSGNLIYYSREQLGTNRNEYFFNYDKFGRLTNFTENYTTPVSENSIDISYSRQVTFTYSSVGIMNAKAELHEGNWLTYYFEIK